MSRSVLDPISLFFGLVFAAVGAFLLVGHAGLLVRLRWAWPLALIAVAALLLTWLAMDRYRGRPLDGPRS
jgi:hypothetical protein